jgi:uncharacterized membrane protein YphA (DoxX/SURF4 family)
MIFFLVYAARFCVAAVFVTALFGKIRSRAAIGGFADSLVRLASMPRQWSMLLTIGVIVVEAVVAVLVAVPLTARFGSALAALVLCGFTGVLLAAARRGATGSCACFGAARGDDTDTAPGTAIVRNAILFALAIVGAVSDRPDRLGGFGLAVAAVLGVVGAALIIGIGDVIALIKPVQKPAGTPARR